MGERVRGALRQAVVVRANNSCEYCGLPDDILQLSHEPDHIVATQYQPYHTTLSPRHDLWTHHFRWEDAWIAPLTATGRATVALLRLNESERLTLRENLIGQSRYPFRDYTI